MAEEIFATQLLPIGKLVSMPFQSRVSKVDVDFEDLVESIKEHGMIEPIVVRPLHDENARYEVVAGERRLKAAKKIGLHVVPCHIKEVPEDVALILQAEENLHRKDYDEEDKTHLVSELARRKGWDANEIAKRLHRSYTWVVKYLPEQFKDKQKAEAGQVGGITKAVATQRVAELEQTIKSQDTTRLDAALGRDASKPANLLECERCHTHSSMVKPEKINGKDHNLCDKCSQHAKLHPEQVASYFRYLERAKEGKVPETKTSKPQETWEFQKSRMKVSPSAMDEMMNIRLHNNEKLRNGGWRVKDQVAYIKILCKSDNTLINDKLGKEIAVFYDFLETHKDKDLEDDAKRMEAAMLHNFVPLPLPYNAVTETEATRLLKDIEAKALQEEA